MYFQSKRGKSKRNKTMKFGDHGRGFSRPRVASKKKSKFHKGKAY